MNTSPRSLGKRPRTADQSRLTQTWSGPSGTISFARCDFSHGRIVQPAPKLAQEPSARFSTVLEARPFFRLCTIYSELCKAARPSFHRDRDENQGVEARRLRQRSQGISRRVSAPFQLPIFLWFAAYQLPTQTFLPDILAHRFSQNRGDHSPSCSPEGRLAARPRSLSLCCARNCERCPLPY